MKPTLLGDESSTTLFNAMVSAMAEAGLDPQQLAASFSSVVFHFGIDGAATCELVIDYFKSLMLVLENVIVMCQDPCLMHSLNRIMSDHQDHSQFKLGDYFSLTKLIRIRSYWDSFCDAVSKEAVNESAIEWTQFGDPPVHCAELHKRIIKLTLPNLAHQPDKKRKVEASLGTLNATWKGKIGHCCIIDANGNSCCASLGACKKKIKQAVGQLCTSTKPSDPCKTRWLTSVENIGWWCLGIMLASLFVRAVGRAWPATAAAAAAAAAVAADPVDDDSNADDSFQVKTGKRMRRGRRNIAGPLWQFYVLVTLTILQPLQLTMGVLMDTSDGLDGEEISICDIVKAINAASTSLCK